MGEGDITVYLPPELLKRAKAAELPFSRLLRSAVEAELARRFLAANAETEEHEVELEDEDGNPYVGRITGTVIAGPATVYYDTYKTETATVFLTDDERVLYYDEENGVTDVSEAPGETLRDFPPDEYTAAMAALGLRAVVDL